MSETDDTFDPTLPHFKSIEDRARERANQIERAVMDAIDNPSPVYGYTNAATISGPPVTVESLLRVIEEFDRLNAERFRRLDEAFNAGLRRSFRISPVEFDPMRFNWPFLTRPV